MQGSRNYNLGEQRHLLDTIAELLQLHKLERASLKSEFAGLLAAAKQLSYGGTSDVENVALELKSKLVYRTQNTRAQDQRCKITYPAHPVAATTNVGVNGGHESSISGESTGESQTVSRDERIDAVSPAGMLSLGIDASSDTRRDKQQLMQWFVFQHQHQAEQREADRKHQ
ncbi:hypothetical protein ON010_g5023 [Phytophthora cinnamomi]|nr:hypothetical protein ON010_g5023 [Phytophthora cinnamomi]